jgi:hypothetical protein
MRVNGRTLWRGITAARLLAVAIALPVQWGMAASGDDETPVVFVDPAGDAMARPTDPGALLPFESELHHLPDLIAVQLGAWEPFEPDTDLYEGEFTDDDSDADSVRLDIVFLGLANPPGSADPDHYDPFAYGPHPVFGVFEVDMDEDVDTGGELSAPQYRFLGNAARFGGAPSGSRFEDRYAVDSSAFDDDVLTEPWVDRSGEEFHLALFGGEFSSSGIVVEAGDSDRIFEAGEIWRLQGRFWHRAHGYERFSFMSGGQYPGEYMPESDLRFAHEIAADRTVVSLIFPLTQAGAARAANEAPEPVNFDPNDQASVVEALADLELSAQFLDKFPSGDPAEVLITRWANSQPEEHLEPSDWRVTALVGSAYSGASSLGVYYLWSDIYPNVVPGDVTGDDEFDPDDVEEIDEFIADNDALDSVSDDAVVLTDFAEDFSVCDINYDGVVDALDMIAGGADGDSDDDEDIDLEDFAGFQRCLLADPLLRPDCVAPNLDMDGEVELDDFLELLKRWNGP